MIVKSKWRSKNDVLRVGGDMFDMVLILILRLMLMSKAFGGGSKGDDDGLGETGMWIRTN